MSGFNIAKRLAASAIILSLPGMVSSGVSQDELIQYGMPPGMADYAANVSASEGSWTSVNQSGCAGAFQFCPETLPEYYSGTRSQFLSDPSAQVNAWVSYQTKQWGYAERNNFTDLIGEEICYGGRCATITASSILKACQFGCGRYGKLGNFYDSRDCSARNVKDGNLHSVCHYLIGGAGFPVEDITNMTEEDLERFRNAENDDLNTASAGVSVILMPWERHAPPKQAAIPGAIN